MCAIFPSRSCETPRCDPVESVPGHSGRHFVVVPGALLHSAPEVHKTAALMADWDDNLQCPMHSASRTRCNQTWLQNRQKRFGGAMTVPAPGCLVVDEYHADRPATR